MSASRSLNYAYSALAKRKGSKNQRQDELVNVKQFEVAGLSKAKVPAEGAGHPSLYLPWLPLSADKHEAPGTPFPSTHQTERVLKMLGRQERFSVLWRHILIWSTQSAQRLLPLTLTSGGPGPQSLWWHALTTAFLGAPLVLCSWCYLCHGMPFAFYLSVISVTASSSFCIRGLQFWLHIRILYRPRIKRLMPDCRDSSAVKSTLSSSRQQSSAPCPHMGWLTTICNSRKPDKVVLGDSTERSYLRATASNSV